MEQCKIIQLTKENTWLSSIVQIYGYYSFEDKRPRSG